MLNFLKKLFVFDHKTANEAQYDALPGFTSDMTADLTTLKDRIDLATQRNERSRARVVF